MKFPSAALAAGLISAVLLLSCKTTGTAASSGPSPSPTLQRGPDGEALLPGGIEPSWKRLRAPAAGLPFLVGSLPEPGLPPLPSPSPSAKAAPSSSPPAKPSPSPSARPSASPKASAKPSPKPSGLGSPKPSSSPKATPSPAVKASLPPVPFSQIVPAGQDSSSPAPAFSVLVQVGKRFEIPMSGTSWTYTGIVKGAQAIRYESKRYDPGIQYFAFTPIETGEYLLEFVRNDLVSDQSEYRYVRVIVTPADGTQASATPQPSTSAGVQFSAPLAGAVLNPSPRPSTAAGYSAALASPALRSNPSPTPIPSSAGASLSATGGQALSASPWASGAQAATVPIASSAAASGASPAAFADAGSPAAAPALAVPDPAALYASGGADALLKAASDLTDKGKPSGALSLLGWALSQGLLSDELLWQLSRAYEAPGPDRDIEKARALLEQLKDDYPESERYDQADSHIEYIDRRYLQIR